MLLRSVHARIQPLLNQRHADKRLAFCQRHIYDDWHRVIFTDEKIFEVDTSGIVYYIPYGRRRPTTPQHVIRSYINNIRNICQQIILNHGWESSQPSRT